MSKKNIRLTIRLNLEHPLYKGFAKLYEDLPEDGQGKKVGVQKLIEQAIANTYGGFSNGKSEFKPEQVAISDPPQLKSEISEETKQLGEMTF